MNLHYLSFLFIWIIPFVLTVFGFAGNVIGFVIFSSKRLSKFPGRNIYRALAIMDTFYLLHVKFQFLLYYYGISIRLLSNLSCKIVRYLNYSLAPISAWLLVYLSIHKYTTIRFVNKSKKYDKSTSFILFMIIFYNLVYYSPVLINVTLVDNTNEIIISENGSSNRTVNYETSYECSFFQESMENIFSLMDLVNLTILPFAFMLTFSMLLICTILKSRFRMFRSSHQSDRHRLRKDFKFAVSCVLLNFIFILLNLPIGLANLSLDAANSYYDAILCIYYMSYCINFYILFFFNSIFRKEVIIFFKN